LSKKLNIDFEVFPGSSFSNDMNLIDESDIDYLISINSIKKEDLVKLTNNLGSLGYLFSKYIYNNEERYYYSFEKNNKETGNVEIEVKVSFAP
jgi:hypothetical protein